MSKTDKKSQVIEEAFKLFLEKGYDAVTIAEIEQAANVSRGLIFHHFSSKADIFKATVDRFVFSHLGSLPYFSKELISSKNPLRTFITVYLEHISLRMRTATEQSEDITRSPMNYFKLFLSLKGNYPDVEEKIEQYECKETELWSKILQLSVERKEIRPDIDLPEVTSIFIHSYYGLSFRQSLLQGLDIASLEKLWMWIYKYICATN
ncbi:TetR/AcrR family transcriptional regulator [Tannerella forsythia]|uniref:TetR/AcrR family transcriptional regulator n=1 Tax=Tannerella forsythia TaxID=28112 RepID=A0A3P1YMJ0_TANFO|nr:helix-turn-helix domain-containing protein [Tannerella forsythia]RRD71370.1 TetR/AcrR family transcriptional regulator [Tannerella forsythia]